MNIIVDIILFCIIVFLIIITTNKGYCYIFEHKDWILWEKIIKESENISSVEYFKYSSEPFITNYTTYITINDINYTIIYWVKADFCSIHVEDQKCVLGNFDKYHNRILCKRIKEIIKHGNVIWEIYLKD